MLYGLLVAGGLLAYYAWKKNKANAEKTMTSPTSTSGTFVDDVSVLETGGIKPPRPIIKSEILEPFILETGGIKPPRPIIKSEILEPFISDKKQLDLSGELI